MKREPQFAGHNWSRRAVLATMLLPTIAGTGRAAPILPPPVSYEYFGFNSADNIVTSSNPGTLNYTGGAGCGGTCTATTQLGLDPAVSLNINEVVFNNSGGGAAQASLGYYVEYMNVGTGPYSITMDAPESLSIGDGLSNAFAYLAFGVAGASPGTFNDFDSYALQEADCVNFGCEDIPVGGVTPAPFVESHSLQIMANTPYFVLLQVQINPSTTGQQLMASIDPQFSATASGGHFVFSDGVIDSSAVPEPGGLVLMVAGLAFLGGVKRRHRPVLPRKA